ncbi:endonuclease domain-containing protein [Cellvibrio sp.]|uniref:endonuclease domain-containing protein n=1 Tax=Cellvibrio sp. TaxID=1965322 RepID=UPI003964801C
MLPYKPTLKPFARKLRSNMTNAEIILWSRLRRKQIMGVQFYRQKPIAGYVADFYCASCSLVIELDGDSHYQDDAQEYDRVRDELMRSMGLSILRFTNQDVEQNLDAVLLKIIENLKSP